MGAGCLYGGLGGISAQEGHTTAKPLIRTVKENPPLVKKGGVTSFAAVSALKELECLMTDQRLSFPFGAFRLTRYRAHVSSAQLY